MSHRRRRWILNIIRDLFPSNAVAAAVDMNVLGIKSVSILFGLGLAAQGMGGGRAGQTCERLQRNDRKGEPHVSTPKGGGTFPWQRELCGSLSYLPSQNGLLLA